LRGWFFYLATLASVFAVTSAIDANPGVMGGKILHIGHALLDDLRVSGLLIFSVFCRVT